MIYDGQPINRYRTMHHRVFFITLRSSQLCPPSPPQTNNTKSLGRRAMHTWNVSGGPTSVVKQKVRKNY